MFLDFYGLREQPFGVTPNPRYLYHSPVHREALASLIYGVEADLGFAALIAEPGMGKTTLLFYLLEKFRTSARTALVFQTQCTALELLRYLANEFDIPSQESDPVVLNQRIRDLLVQEARARRHVIVIIDEAQNLSEDALETIRLLSDFETPEFKLLHIILAGQPQLAEKLARPSLAQLLQRISMLNRLNPLTAEEIRNYVEYRLGVAGYRGPAIFNPAAIEAVGRLSGGVPRRINRICFNALSLGCALKRRIIDAAVIEEVGADLDISTLLYDKGAISLAEDEPDDPVQMRSTGIDAGTFAATTAAPAVVRTPPAVVRPSSAAPIPVVLPVSAAPMPVPMPVAHSTPSRPNGGASSVVTGPGASSAVAGVGAHRTTVAPPAPKPRSVVPINYRAPGEPVKASVQPRTGSVPAQRTSSAKKHKPFVLFEVICAVLLLAGWGIWKMPSPLRPAAAANSVQNRNPAGTGVEVPTSEPETPAALEPTLAKKAHTPQAPQQSGSRAARPPLKAETSKAPAPGYLVEPGSPLPGGFSQRASQAPTSNTASNTTVVDFGPEIASRQEPGRASRGVVPASLLKRVQPVYPAAAQRAGVEGTVVVAAVIARDGRPKNVRAVSGNALLTQAAVDAVRKWVYRPYLLNGEPEDVDTQVVINFGLSASPQ